MSKKINIALVGLGFGAEFIPIYQAHPNANLVAVCQRDPKKLKAIQDAFGIAKGYTDYDELLRDPEIDAVHINTPIPDHAPQSIKALKAGKHVACTVPMATSIEDCRKIVDLTKKTGLKYMMMETVVYAREYLFAKELYEKGELGRIQTRLVAQPCVGAGLELGRLALTLGADLDRARVTGRLLDLGVREVLRDLDAALRLDDLRLHVRLRGRVLEQLALLLRRPEDCGPWVRGDQDRRPWHSRSRPRLGKGDPGQFH